MWLHSGIASSPQPVWALSLPVYGGHSTSTLSMTSLACSLA